MHRRERSTNPFSIPYRIKIYLGLIRRKYLTSCLFVTLLFSLSPPPFFLFSFFFFFSLRRPALARRAIVVSSPSPSAAATPPPREISCSAGINTRFSSIPINRRVGISRMFLIVQRAPIRSLFLSLSLSLLHRVCTLFVFAIKYRKVCSAPSQRDNGVYTRDNFYTVQLSSGNANTM